MADLVQIEAVFIIVWMVGLIIVQLILKFCLHIRIGCLRRQHIRVLRKIGRQEHAADARAAHHGAGGHPTEQQPHTSADAHYQQDHLTMLFDEYHGFLRRLLRVLGGTLGCGSSILRRFFSLAYLFGIVPLNTFLLQISGDWIRRSQGRIVMERLLVEEICVGLDGSLFRLNRVPPGFHAVLTDSGADLIAAISYALLRQFLAFMPSLHTHIFMLHLVDLAVDGGF